jgi:hypothetical protein
MRTLCCGSTICLSPNGSSRPSPDGGGADSSTPSPAGSTPGSAPSGPRASARTTGASTPARSRPTSCSRIDPASSPSSAICSTTPCAHFPLTMWCASWGSDIGPRRPRSTPAMPHVPRAPYQAPRPPELAQALRQMEHPAGGDRDQQPDRLQGPAVRDRSQRSSPRPLDAHEQGHHQPLAIRPDRRGHQPPLPRRPGTGHTQRARHRPARLTVPPPPPPGPPLRPIQPHLPTRRRTLPRPNRRLRPHQRPLQPRPPAAAVADSTTHAHRRRLAGAADPSAVSSESSADTPSWPRYPDDVAIVSPSEDEDSWRPRYTTAPASFHRPSPPESFSRSWAFWRL